MRMDSSISPTIAPPWPTPALRGGGAYRRAVEALERLRGSAIVRTVNFVVTRRNADQLDADGDGVGDACGP